MAREAAVEQGFVGAICVVYEHLFRHLSGLFLLRCKVKQNYRMNRNGDEIFLGKCSSCRNEHKDFPEDTTAFGEVEVCIIQSSVCTPAPSSS